ncbi:hypothetical protein [Oceanobacillus halotolerans]|uniref:hypothetical protein n=1 Tax=Oceanobacillus halotolerans TaxID=2663380 RepID=UPI0013DD0A65|nr:hypothetical protein [Oceanobacillus halotolerans]
MGFVNWYDWIQPTNPYASIFFGIIFTVIIAAVVWFDTKEFKTIGVVFIIGIVVTFVGVLLLYTAGYYGS